MTALDTRIRGYWNVPPYETAPLAHVTKSARYGFATRAGGTGAVVNHAYASIHEARRQRLNAQRRREWTSHLLERVGAREWVPADPKIRVMYRIESGE